MSETRAPLVGVETRVETRVEAGAEPATEPGTEVRIGRIVLNRPERSNAYTQDMLAAIEAAFERFENDPHIGVVVVTGTGERAFCAGADRHELATRTPESVRTLKAAEIFARIEASRLVSIALINGAAVGGGLELALACDIRLAADHATFWLPEPEFGLLPAAGALQRLPAAVGQGPAREMILGGARWDASRAFQVGLVSEIAPLAALHELEARWTARITKRAPHVLALAKQSLALRDPAASAAFDLTTQAQLVAKNRETQ
jgi:enoyl-CoA hydratase